jgi:hypothetical protein
LLKLKCKIQTSLSFKKQDLNVVIFSAKIYEALRLSKAVDGS